MLHFAGAQVGVHVDGHFAGGNFTPDFVNANAVLTAEALRAYVNFARAFRRFAFDGVRVAEAHAAADSAWLTRRANAAAGFVDRDIDIRIARPGNANNAIADDRVLQIFQKLFLLGVVAFAGEPL